MEKMIERVCYLQGLNHLGGEKMSQVAFNTKLAQISEEYAARHQIGMEEALNIVNREYKIQLFKYDLKVIRSLPDEKYNAAFLDVCEKMAESLVTTNGVVLTLAQRLLEELKSEEEGAKVDPDSGMGTLESEPAIQSVSIMDLGSKGEEFGFAIGESEDNPGVTVAEIKADPNRGRTWDLFDANGFKLGTASSGDKPYFITYKPEPVEISGYRIYIGENDVLKKGKAYRGEAMIDAKRFSVNSGGAFPLEWFEDRPLQDGDLVDAKCVSKGSVGVLTEEMTYEVEVSQKGKMVWLTDNEGESICVPINYFMI